MGYFKTSFSNVLSKICLFLGTCYNEEWKHPEKNLFSVILWSSSCGRWVAGGSLCTEVVVVGGALVHGLPHERGAEAAASHIRPAFSSWTSVPTDTLPPSPLLTAFCFQTCHR